MIISNWLSNNYLEVFGAITGIIYVFLEIRQTIWLWPVGIITSTVYIWIFFTSKFYADMSLQGYYLIISVLGWYWWTKGAGHRAQGKGQRAQGTGIKNEEGSRRKGERDVKEGESGRNGESEKSTLKVTRLEHRAGIVLTFVFLILFAIMWFVLSRLTDSPVPGWDSFLTSLSIVATWMLARKIYEHWYLWIIVNVVSVFIYFTRGLYPTVILYAVYGIMSFVGLVTWGKTIRYELKIDEE
jgi:nicotinamide mononucleotide transporter